jgi:hypothetical protein
MAWAATPANADTLEQIGNGGLETLEWTLDGTPDSGLAGGITLTLVNTTGAVIGPTINTVCTDLGGTVYLGYTYSYSAPTIFNGLTGLSPTWGVHPTSAANELAAINVAADIFYNNESVLTSGSTDQKAGLQLAVWAALYNTVSGPTTTALTGPRLTFTPAQITADGAAYTDALADIAGASLTKQFVGDLLIPDPTVQYSLTAQEMLVNVTPVPEPTTLIAGAMVLLPFAASTLRLRKKLPA